MRATFSTEKEVRLKPYDPEGLSRPTRPPRSLGVLARGFPRLEPPAEDGPVADGAEGRRDPGESRPRRAGRRSVAPAIEAGPLPPVIEAEAALARRGTEVVQTQFEQEGFEDDPFPLSPEPVEPEVDLPPIEVAPPVVPGSRGRRGEEPPTSLLPCPPRMPDRPRRGPPRRRRPGRPPTAPILPGTQRVTSIYPRSGGPGFTFETQPTTPDGTSIAVIRGGVNIVIQSPPPIGTVDVSADSAIIWRKVDPEKGAKGLGPDGELVESTRQPMEVYLEGHVVFRQDERMVAGNGDQKTYRAERVFYNVQSDRLVALNAELDMFAPGLVAPVNMKSPRIEQYRPLERAADGKLVYGFQEIHADQTVLTGSRFPNPGYRFTSRSVDVRRVVSDQADPNTGRTVGQSGRPADAAGPDLADRRAAELLLPRPGPRLLLAPLPGRRRRPRPADPADRLPVQQLLRPAGPHRLERVQALRHPEAPVDRQLEPRHRLPERARGRGRDRGRLVRQGPLPRPERPLPPEQEGVPDGHGAVLRLPRHLGAEGRGDRRARGRPRHRHGPPRGRQEGLPADDPSRPSRISAAGSTCGTCSRSSTDEADPYEDFRLQVEAAYISDRHFLEEYYKRLFDVGLDQETLAYLIRQQREHARGRSMPRRTSRTGTPTPSGSPSSTTTAWATRSWATSSPTISTPASTTRTRTRPAR